MKSNLMGSRRRHWKGATLFILFALGFMFFLFRHPHNRHATKFANIEVLGKLRDRFLKDGIDGFLEEKHALREQVKETLSEESEGSDNALRATRLATYLFPEVLPDTNFEKPVAEDLWAPLEKRIEDKPRSPASRETFEELRATIWNYENPNRQTPEISEDANQVIRIYDAISAP